MTATFTSTRSHQAYMQGMSKLTELANAGTLNREILDSAMRVIYDDGDFIDRSIGFDWIVRQPDLFAATAQRCQFEADEFLRTHVSIAFVGCCYLIHGKVVALIPAAKREQFVRDIFTSHGAFNNGWIAEVLALGITKATVSELIIASLEAVGDDCETTRSTISDAVKDFIAYGHSDGSRASPWSVLSKKDLNRALALCARKAPRRFLDHRFKIESELGTDHFGSLAREAILKLHGLTDAQVKFVQEQGFAFQRQVAGNLTANPEFLISVIAGMDPEKGQQLFASKKEVFAEANIGQLYRTTFESRQLREGVAKADWLESELAKLLAADGWIIGTVSMKPFVSKAGLRQMQAQVVHGERVFVVERRQSGYRPAEGDKVLINTRTGQRLTPKVTAVVFFPAHSGVKVTSY